MDMVEVLSAVSKEKKAFMHSGMKAEIDISKEYHIQLIEDLEKKAKLTESEIAFFDREANKLLFDALHNLSHPEWHSDLNKEIEDLEKKAKLTESEIAFFERKANKLLFDIFQNSNWYPECHNDLNKGKCDHCMDCWSKECNQVNCDRVGRCMCPNSSCICLGRY